VLAERQALADAADRRVSVDSTTVRVHEHGATAGRSSSVRRRTQGESG
jgi:hypothetical protein